MKQQHGQQSWGKRGLTIFLTLSLMASLLTTAAFAEGETEDEGTILDEVVEEVEQDIEEENEEETEEETEDESEVETENTDNNGNDGIMLLSLDDDDDTCDHDWTTYPCSSGWVYQYCSKCGAESDGQVYVVPTQAHTGSGWQWEEDEDRAVCESGTQITVCTVCGETLSYRYIVSKGAVAPDVAEHTWTDWEVEEPATACSTGVRSRQCEVCGQGDLDVIPATGNGEHTWGKWTVGKAATACGTGYRYRICDICGEWDSEEIPATGNGEHTWGEWEVEKEATACSTGSRSRKCKVCGSYDIETIAATGSGEHTWGEWTVLVDATCASGIKSRTCKVCGKTIQQLIPPVTSGHVHTWSDWELTEDNGCEGGVLTRYCTAAEKSNPDYEEYIWAWENCDDFVAPAVDTEQKKVAGTGTHDWGDWQDQVSCYDIDQIRQCQKCGQVEYQTIEGTGQHNWGEWEEVDATKCRDSYKIRECQTLGCSAYEMNKTDQEICHHTSVGTIYIASCIRIDYYVANTYCISCGASFVCDEDGNQLFDENGASYWTELGVGYDPNNHDGGTKLVGAVAATATTNGYTGDLYCLGCDALIEAGEVIYPVISGADSTWDASSTSDLSIRSNADISKFVKVLVNGEELASKYYTVKEGSTIVTLSQEYLSTLKNGEYTIEIVSTDGSAATTFTVTGAAAAPTDTKKEEPTGSTETKKDETTVSTDTKKDTTKTDTKSDTKTDTKSDSATSTNPKTGDESSLVLWVIALGISFAALALLAVWNKKRYTGKRVK
jgi:hypothetical protein